MCGWSYPFIVIFVDVTKEFQDLRRELDSFKKFLQGLEVASREEEIKKAYLAKLGPFNILPKIFAEAPSGLEKMPEQGLNELLQKIKAHPTQTKELLLQIMQKFPMKDQDRYILAETFAGLPFPEMEKALMDLKKSFY
jgi:hypothetical protein